MARLLVTGADGFVGRFLVRAALGDGLSVIAAIPPGGTHPREWLSDSEAAGVETLEAELLTEEGIGLLVGKRPDAVVHLAAVASGSAARRDPAAAMAINKTATIALVDAMIETGAESRFLFVSTAEVYGSGHTAAIPETAPRRPVSPYAASKAEAELELEQRNGTAGVSVVVARAFPHSGPGQSTAYALPAFAARLIAANKAGAGVIPVGNLDVVRDILDVRDVVRAYLLLLRHGRAGECYNVASGIGQHLGELLVVLTELIGATVTAEPDPELIRPSDIPVLIGDPTKTAEATGWRPRIEITQTLQDLVDAQAD